MKTRILVSACLLGENCKYSGGNNYCEKAAALSELFDLIPVCPEVFGGLPVPREPSEICGDRVMTESGVDVTAQFTEGAEQTLYIAQEKNCPAALLKERSPSCGCGAVYDGTFSGTLKNSNGFTAELLLQHGIAVFGESQADKLCALYGDA